MTTFTGLTEAIKSLSDSIIKTEDFIEKLAIPSQKLVKEVTTLFCDLTLFALIAPLVLMNRVYGCIGVMALSKYKLRVLTYQKNNERDLLCIII